MCWSDRGAKANPKTNMDAYNSSTSSSTVRPDCFKMSERVPLARVECCGTTVRNTLSPVRFSRETWLPFCRSTLKPARLRARTRRSPDMLGSRLILFCDFDECPERLLRNDVRVGPAPGFKI